MSSMKPKGPAQTTPKHGKRVENRLWSKWHRGPEQRTEQIGGLNPDGTISVVAVCGNEARRYAKVKWGRKLESVDLFPSHGAAKLYADEFERWERVLQGRQIPTL